MNWTRIKWFDFLFNSHGRAESTRAQYFNRNKVSRAPVNRVGEKKNEFKQKAISFYSHFIKIYLGLSLGKINALAFKTHTQKGWFIKQTYEARFFFALIKTAMHSHIATHQQGYRVTFSTTSGGCIKICFLLFYISNKRQLMCVCVQRLQEHFFEHLPSASVRVHFSIVLLTLFVFFFHSASRR